MSAKALHFRTQGRLPQSLKLQPSVTSLPLLRLPPSKMTETANPKAVLYELCAAPPFLIPHSSFLIFHVLQLKVGKPGIPRLKKDFSASRIFSHS
jgi:hypothetical protein